MTLVKINDEHTNNEKYKPIKTTKNFKQIVDKGDAKNKPKNTTTIMAGRK